MVELRVSSGTTMQELQAFMKDVGSTDKLRGKRNDDGSITLYSKDANAFSFGFKRGKRADKTAAARDAIGFVLSNTAGTNVRATKSLANLMTALPTERGREVTGMHLNQMISGAKPLVRSEVNTLKQEIAQDLPNIFDRLRASSDVPTVKLADLPNLSFDIGRAIEKASNHGAKALSLEEAMEIAEGVIERVLTEKAGAIDRLAEATKLVGLSGSEVVLTEQMRGIFEKFVLTHELGNLKLPLTDNALHRLFNDAIADHVSMGTDLDDENSTSAILTGVLEKHGLNERFDEIGLKLDDIELHNFRDRELHPRIVHTGKLGDEPVTFAMAREVVTARSEKLATLFDNILDAAGKLSGKGAKKEEIGEIARLTMANLGRPEFVDVTFALKSSAGKMMETLLDDKSSLQEKIAAIRDQYEAIGTLAMNALKDVPSEDRGPDDGAILQTIYNELVFGENGILGEEGREAVKSLLSSPEVLAFEGAVRLMQNISDEAPQAMLIGANIADLRKAIDPDGGPPVVPEYGRLSDLPSGTHTLLEQLAPLSLATVRE